MSISLWLGTCCTRQLARKIRDRVLGFNARLQPSCQATSSTLRVLWFALLFSVLSACPNHVLGAAPEASDGDQPERAPCCCRFQERTFDTLGVAVERTKEVLSLEECASSSFVVFVVTSEDDRLQSVRARLSFVGGYLPMDLRAGEANAILIGSRRQRAVVLRIQAPGYVQAERRIIGRPGEVTVLDDIVLHRTTQQTGVSLLGRVWLEDDGDTDGMVISVNQNDVAFVDENGYFESPNIDAGHLRISSIKPGYHIVAMERTAKPGEEVAVELRGYRVRYATVRWEYQPDEHSDFSYGTEYGDAILSTGGLHRVSFARGFGSVSHAADFIILQKQNRLVVKVFNRGSTVGPAFRRLDGSRLENILDIPKVPHPSRELVLRPGGVYVFQCFDGEHYGKMEVLDISVEPPPPDDGE